MIKFLVNLLYNDFMYNVLYVSKCFDCFVLKKIFGK